MENGASHQHLGSVVRGGEGGLGLLLHAFLAVAVAGRSGKAHGLHTVAHLEHEKVGQVEMPADGGDVVDWVSHSNAPQLCLQVVHSLGRHVTHQAYNVQRSWTALAGEILHDSVG